eukprot:751444_1
MCLVVSLADERVLRQDQSHNQTVKSQSLGENEDQNHTNEELLLLANRSHTSISNNSNGHTGSESRKTAAKSSSQMCESGVKTVLTESILGSDDGSLDNNSHDETVNTQNSRHDHWDNVTHNKAGVHD